MTTAAPAAIRGEVTLSRLLNPVTLKPVLAKLDAVVEQADAESAKSILLIVVNRPRESP
jgi:hypothetical protein